MEDRNSEADSQIPDKSQPIQETEGDVGPSNTVGGKVEVVATADGGEGGGVELGIVGGEAEMAKKKRGRPPRVQSKSPPAKINKEEDEDVCFICFDGGSLVLCDRRGCPKAYHPACVKRDAAFFQSKAKWNCGWHICSICQKTAHHMCYTCTYSVCKGCIKTADYVCVRGDKGFCTMCMKTIMLIESNGQEKDEKAQVDFDDKTSWEYLFKVYWVYLKRNLSLTLDELTQAKNPWKGATTIASDSVATCVDNGGRGNDQKTIMPDTSLQNLESSESRKRKIDEQISIKRNNLRDEEWATKELLDFVAHMKNGDTSVLSQFDVQELMLEYIKRNNLRDPRKKSQIICDSRLKILFGKPRVGHFEMLKLLEFHFSIKDLPKNPVNSVARQAEPDWNGDIIPKTSKDKKRRNQKKYEERAPQNKVDEYAAIDVHNMNLVYLRRKLMENLIGNREEFHGKVVGSIVRIRISGSDHKHDMYRLVQVVGTSKADAPYKIGNKSADVVLEVLNLDKKETVSIDTISNQDLSEDECRRLRQSMRCGLVKRFTVGEIQDKAMSLQPVRLKDWMEAETLRLNNLRDRASEKGNKKDLREYVEKLQLLKTPEERERRLREIPEVHSDPKMNPNYEIDDTEDYFNKENGENTKLKHSGVSRKNTNSPVKRTESSNSIARKNGQVNITREEASTKSTRRINIEKDCHVSNSSGRSNGSWKQRTTASESEATTSSYSLKNTPTSNDSETDKVWHYRDPSGKIQGPFCMIQLQKWSTTGYFPVDMRIWRNKEDESLLLNDVLKEHKTSIDKVGIRIEGLTVRTTIPSSQKPVNHEKVSDSHCSSSLTSLQNSNSNPNPNPNPPELASPTPVENKPDTNHGSSVLDIANLEDLPSPTPKTSHEHEKEKHEGDKEQLDTRNNASDVKTDDEWSGYSPTKVKHEERNSTEDGDQAKDVGEAQLSKTVVEWSGYSPTKEKNPEVGRIEQIIVPQVQVREMIEFSTLAEESVSDLLAEVDAMESQNGFPSPTSRRNSFVDDLFNGSFEDFSPTPDPGARSDGFSSNGTDIQLPIQSTAAATTTIAATEEIDGFIPMEERGSPARLSLAIGNFSNPGRPGQDVLTRVNPNPIPNVNWTGDIGWDPHHYVGERYSSSERSYKVEDLGCSRSSKSSWGRQLSFSSGSGGSYSRPPPKGQRVCKFYESGRCKKGASCNYWHP